MPFLSQCGCIKDILVTEEELIDRFVGHELWAWGRIGNTLGVGDNTTIVRSSPVQTISGGTNWKDVRVGIDGMGGIKTDGTLWSWGAGDFHLGQNSATNRSSPVQTISGGTNWKSAHSGALHAMGIKTDGTLWLWGALASGRLGNNVESSTAECLSPVQTISGGKNWRSACGHCGHTAATKTDGTLWLWGCAGNGRLGNNNTATNRSSPIQTISGGTDWKYFSLGRYHSAATKTDGTLWLWGGGFNGALGTNSTIAQSSPVQTISGGTNWRNISTGECTTVATKTDGSLWLWGEGSNGKHGNNSTINQSSPVQTISGGTNWRIAKFALAHAVAIKTDGTLWSWGYNGRGALGNNSTIHRSSPVQTISGGTDWRSIAAFGQVTGALRVTEF